MRWGCWSKSRRREKRRKAAAAQCGKRSCTQSQRAQGLLGKNTSPTIQVLARKRWLAGSECSRVWVLHSLSVMFCLRPNSEFFTYVFPSLPSGVSPNRVMGCWARLGREVWGCSDTGRWGEQKGEEAQSRHAYFVMEGCVCERCKEELSVCAGGVGLCCGVTHICSSRGQLLLCSFLLWKLTLQVCLSCRFGIWFGSSCRWGNGLFYCMVARDPS